jgi:hypothetical protein
MQFPPFSPFSPVPSALQTPRARTTSFFVVQITDFDEFRIRGLLVHFGARCVCVPVFLHSRARWSTCFAPPLPPPPLFCLSSTPHPRISRKLRLLETRVEMSTRRRVWVLRGQKHYRSTPHPHARTIPSSPLTTRVLFFERFRRRKAEFPPRDHAFTHEMSSGRPQRGSCRCVAYFDASRGVPTYSQCPRGSEGDRSVPQHRQQPCSSMFLCF